MRLEDVLQQDELFSFIKEQLTEEVNNASSAWFESLYEFEAYCVLQETNDFISQHKHKLLTDVNLELFKSFFVARWQRVRETDLVYPHAPKRLVTALLLRMAYIFSSHLEIDPYLLLMPSVDTTENVVTGTSFKAEILSLREFILSDGSCRFIEVIPSLQCAEEDGLYKHTSLFGENGDQVKELSEKERERVIHHSKEAEAYVETMVDIVNLQKRGTSIGAFVQRLIDELRHGSTREHGTEYKAGEDANVGIVEFAQFVENLSEEDKTSLFSRKASNESKESFGELWDRLTADKKVVSKLGELTVNYCVAIIANKLEDILKAHPNLFDIFPARGADLQQATHKDLLQKRAERQSRLNLAIAREGYQVTATYGAYGRKALCRRLFNLSDWQAMSPIAREHRIKYLVPRLKRLPFYNYIKNPTECWQLLQFFNNKQLSSLITSSAKLIDLLKSIPKDKRSELLNKLNLHRIQAVVSTSSDLDVLLNLLDNPWCLVETLNARRLNRLEWHDGTLTDILNHLPLINRGPFIHLLNPAIVREQITNKEVLATTLQLLNPADQRFLLDILGEERLKKILLPNADSIRHVNLREATRALEADRGDYGDEVYALLFEVVRGFRFAGSELSAPGGIGVFGRSKRERDAVRAEPEAPAARRNRVA